MEIFALSFVVVSLAVLGMAVGAIAGRRPLTGGCGGLECGDGTGIECGACGTGGGDGEHFGRKRGRRAAGSP